MSDETTFIQASRVSGGETDEVHVTLSNEDTHIRVSLSLEAFARLITGGEKTPCKATRWVIGKVPVFDTTHVITEPTNPKAPSSLPRRFSGDVERNPECGCHRCNPDAWWMIVCETCGNKRCPHATDHDLACTSSNEPGQKGSVFENCKSFKKEA